MPQDSTKLVVLGASSFIDLHTLIRDINAAGKERYEVIALLDDDPGKHGAKICDVPVVGSLAKAREYADDIAFVLGVNNFARRVRRLEIIRELAFPLERFPRLIHPSCVIGDYAEVGFGTQIYPFSSIKNTTTLGSFCVFFEYFAASTHVRVADGCLGGGRVSLLDSCTISSCVFVGTGAVIAENVALGAGCMVGAHSLVTRKIQPGHFTMGNPATKQIPNISLPIWLAENEAATGISL